MCRLGISLTTRVGPEGPFRVELPLEPGTLNERLFEIGLWLIEREIPHQARVLMKPDEGVVRISFPYDQDAEAFRARFSPRPN